MRTTANKLVKGDYFAFHARQKQMKITRIDVTKSLRTGDAGLDIFTAGEYLPFYVYPSQRVYYTPLAFHVEHWKAGRTA